MAEKVDPEWRHVESRDPTLDAGSNAEVTAQLRDAVGADDVVVAAATPDHRAAAHRPGSPLLASLIAMRLALLVAGFVVAIAIGVWSIAAEGAWALVALLVVLVAGGVALTASVLHMASEPEHLAPELVADLEDAGDVDPDRAFNDLVDELSRRPPTRE